MSIWVLLKFGVEKHNITIDLLTKNQPDPVRSLGEKSKSSPTGKFAAHVVKGVANSNSLINPSYGGMPPVREGSNGFLGVSWT
jgi:hypothetical protein